MKNLIAKLKFSALFELAIFFTNLLGGLVLTRHVSLEVKSVLVLSTVLPSLYVAINQSSRTESIFISTHLYINSRRNFLAQIFSIAISIFVLFFLHYGIVFWVVLIPLCVFSAQNSSKLALVYVNKGPTIYSSLRLMHIFFIQLCNFTYIFLFVDWDPIYLVSSYLFIEFLLTLIVSRFFCANFGQLLKKENAGKIGPYFSIAVIFGTNFEIILLYLVAIFSEHSTLALFSVSLSIISPFFVFSSLGVPLILSRTRGKPNAEEARASRALLACGSIFILSCVYLGTILSDLIIVVFGENYKELSISSYLLIPSGLAMVGSRLIDAELRKNYHHSTSLLCNILSLVGFSILFSSKQLFAVNFCRFFFIGAILQFVIFTFGYLLFKSRP